jgi:hypothetical protein
VVFSSASEIQKQLKEVESFISEAKKKLGAEENVLEKNYMDKKEKLCGFVGTFNELTNLSQVSFSVCAKSRPNAFFRYFRVILLRDRVQMRILDRKISRIRDFPVCGCTVSITSEGICVLR